MIRLNKYNPTDFDVLNGYLLDNIQAQFTADIDYCINERKDLNDSDKIIVVITFEGMPVGFFVLDSGADKFTLTDNPNAVVIRSLSVNPKYQGKGIGKQAMTLVPDFLREYLPNINEIVLSVNCKNQTAYQVYKKAGYTDTGRKIDGPIGQQYVLNQKL